MRIARVAFAAAIVLSLISVAAMAADPVRKEGTWVARDFKFHTGEVMPELRLAYTTIGEPTSEPVLYGNVHAALRLYALPALPVRRAADARWILGYRAPLPASARTRLRTHRLGPGIVLVELGR